MLHMFFIIILKYYVLFSSKKYYVHTDAPNQTVLTLSTKTLDEPFVNRTLHWPVTRWTKYALYYYFILAFDIGSELFREVLLPETFRWRSALGLQLSVSKDQTSIALFAKNNKINASCLDMGDERVLRREVMDQIG